MREANLHVSRKLNISPPPAGIASTSSIVQTYLIASHKMTAHDLVISGGTVVTAAGIFQDGVGTRDGRIVSLSDSLAGDDTTDASDRVVPRGGIDRHVHVS